MTAGCRVIVMAKAPVAGYAKTRLIPALGAEGAAGLAERLLEHAVLQALEAGLGPVEICGAPDTTHRAFQRYAGQAGIALHAQGDGDLGERMHRALARALAGAAGCAVATPGPAPDGRSPAGALLIGTDAPGLDRHVLHAAAAALREHDAVFVPALDGGYALVGLRRPAPALFDGMRWSTPEVMADTRDRLARAGLRHAELPAVPDIDEPADLVHVPAPWLEELAAGEPGRARA